LGEKHVYDSWEDLLRILENKKFENDIQYFQNDLNLTKELQSKAGYRKPDEKMFMLLPAQ
jgi:hypothetical protein